MEELGRGATVFWVPKAAPQDLHVVSWGPLMVPHASHLPLIDVKP